MKAMILAAGIGSRLGALTAKTPKCLIDIGGKPMLRLVAESLAKAGVRKVIINLHHHAELVRSYASSSLSDLFEEVAFSFEPQLLGTGGGLKACANFFSDSKVFLLVNADIYSDFPLSKLVDALLPEQNLMGTLAVMQREDSSYLKFTHEGNLSGWLRASAMNPSVNSALSSSEQILAFCGLQALSSRIFDYLNQESQISFSIIDSYMRAIVQGEKLAAVKLDNYNWIDMGTPERLDFLRESFKPRRH